MRQPSDRPIREFSSYVSRLLASVGEIKGGRPRFAFIGRILAKLTHVAVRQFAERHPREGLFAAYHRVGRDDHFPVNKTAYVMGERALIVDPRLVPFLI